MPNIRKLFPFLFLCVLCAVFSLAGFSNARAAEFLTPSKTIFLDMDTKQVNFSYDREDLKFVLQDDDTLRLMSRDGTHDYLSFSNYYEPGAGSGTDYAVREIPTDDPGLTFYEINADVGAHAQNCGYWLIGKRNGRWVAYVSLDNLAAMGYTIGDWHQIRTFINHDGDGRFILTSRHEYMPPEAVYGYQRRFAVDLRIELFWDDNAQWIGMRSL